MAMKIDIKNLPLYLKIIVAAIPSLILIILFIFLIYSPKKEQVNVLNAEVAKLSNEIATSEVKVRKLDVLKAENAMLRAKLSKLQEQLPEEKEVSVLLKQISDLGLKSGLKILLWKPGARKTSASGLYLEIPVTVEVVTGYHNLGVFFSYISRLPRIVNMSNIDFRVKGKHKGQIAIKFTALTFAAISPTPKDKNK